MTAARGLVGAALLGVGMAVMLPSPVRGQERNRLTERCAAGATPESSCRELGLAVEAVLGGVGLALAGGGELPGSPSTLGRRYGTSPRWAFAGRVGLAQFDLPGLDPANPPAAVDVWVPTVQGQVAAGLFDGFRLGPTVGGFLSLDLLVTGGVAFLPESDGFDGAVPAWGYGARIGFLRESFSLPAVTLGLVRRHVAGFRYGEAGAPGMEVDDLTVTSVRATVGKELMALGILAGLGWDQARGGGTARPPVAGASLVDFDDLDARRFLIFGALTRTWLVVQATAEAGFATGYDARTADPVGDGPAYDPTGGSFFGGLAFRLIY